MARGLGFDETEFRKGLKAAAGVRAVRKDGLAPSAINPERAGEIAGMGAERLLASPFASNLLSKLSKATPGEAGYDLEGAERVFWDRWRGPEAPDLTMPDMELQALQENVDEWGSQRRIQHGHSA